MTEEERNFHLGQSVAYRAMADQIMEKAKQAFVREKDFAAKELRHMASICRHAADQKKAEANLK